MVKRIESTPYNSSFRIATDTVDSYAGNLLLLIRMRSGIDETGPLCLTVMLAVIILKPKVLLALHMTL